MNKSVFILALLGAAQAQALEVGVNTFSVHDRAGFHTVTPGAYALVGSTAIGVLRNSEAHTGLYAAYLYQTPSRRFAVLVGGITGYRWAVTPMVVPSVRMEPLPGVAVRLSMLARVPGATAANCLHVSVEWQVR